MWQKQPTRNCLSELAQLKLNIGASDGDSTPPEVGVLEMDKGSREN